MNPFKKLNKTHPRIWAIIVFPIFIFGTLVVFPLDILINFVPCIFSELKSAFRHIIWDWRDCCKEPVYVIKWCWRDWYTIITTGKGLKTETYVENGEQL